MIVNILQSEFNFKATTHERNIYHAEVKGEVVFICQEVDDFAIAANTAVTADYIISIINKHVSTTNKGLGTKYNGLDVLQICNYIKLHCDSITTRFAYPMVGLSPALKNLTDMIWYLVS